MSDEDRFEQALEKLLADRSPRSEVTGLSEEQQRMVRMVQLLRGSRGQEPAAELADRLHARLFPQKHRVSRRTAFLSGLGALAAGVLAGLGLDRAVQNAPSGSQEPLVGANGRWYPVATLSDLPDGAMRPFTAGAVQGFLIRRNGQLWALSRVCTHMGCTLQINRAEQTFECPCHGAEFDFQGHLHNLGKYGQVLPSLPPIKTRVKGETVEVFGA
jgi:nitrite reductase/ring-hydroxylating ferredoxin subunit